ncbi:flagellar hook-associated protein FlgK [Marinisporobacter balticus]|uniref:Flagellar hook-associated protein 1 n=1 Tax=Marinisporobacter balticus TaxID=2018667 RepID=A0A4V2SBQ6_9FIRM|nr:flagellar hook-associated protein FlgK [Marinisporobacter balticus]TCO76470.1 flagellar hook-associated protein 1 FlgK [Marinisporobacter balticus]
MSGAFFGLNIAKSGVFASQRALNVTGHNIANAGTPGYSRQRLNVTESNPMTLSGGQGMLGSGVDTTSIRQIRDEFLDFKIRKEFTTSGEWETRLESLQQLEATFNEPSNSGIRKVMDEFFSSIQELSEGEKSDNLTVRTQVRERGIALTKTLNKMYNQFKDMQKNTDFAVETTVDQINGYTKQISKLNKQIFTYELDGSNANDLRDQRNLLIDELSNLVNIEVTETPVGDEGNISSKMKIMLGGNILVSHENYNALKTTSREVGEEKNYVDNPKLLEIEWENGDMFHCKSGKLKGLLDMRDNIDGKEKGIPYYMDKLNKFTTVFAAEFNMQHGSGYGLAGAGTGIPFFNSAYLMKVPETDPPTIPPTPTPVPTGYKYLTDTAGTKIQDKDGNFYITKDLSDGGMEPVSNADITALGGTTDTDIIQKFEEKNKGYTLFKAEGASGSIWLKVKMVKAGDIDISDEIHKDLNNIAAGKKGYDSSNPPDGILDSALAGDGSNALALNALRNDEDIFSWGTPDDYFKSLISNLGVDGQEAQRMTDNQLALVTQIDNTRQSISGVSLDEEMTNMIKYQQTYNACARMITVADEMLDKIINGMGVVGR